MANFLESGTEITVCNCCTQRIFINNTTLGWTYLSIGKATALCSVNERATLLYLTSVYLVACHIAVYVQ